MIQEPDQDASRQESSSSISPMTLWTDEERDIAAYQSYLRTLSPESLWDIHGHLDPDLYPRRVETVQREMNRRSLFFLSPYSLLEQSLRNLFGLCLALAVLAAALRAIGGFRIALEPGEKLPWFFDLAVGGPIAARMVLPLVRFAATGVAAWSAVAVLLSLYHFARRHLRRDVLVTGVLVVLLSLALLRLALTPGV